jgi:hypothetical protein
MRSIHCKCLALAAACSFLSAPSYGDILVSDTLKVTDPSGTILYDASLPELSEGPEPFLLFNSGRVTVTPAQKALLEEHAVIFVDPQDGSESDVVELLLTGFQSDPLLYRFRIFLYSGTTPPFVPPGPDRVSETDKPVDVTADLFPEFIRAGQPPPYSVIASSDLDVPEPQSIFLNA